MSLMKWFIALACVTLLNWSAATWFANHQYSTSSEILQQKIDNETSLLADVNRLNDNCKGTRRDDFSPHRALCDLSQDSQTAMQMRINRFEQARKNLLTERNTNQTIMLAILGLTSFALAAVFLLMQASSTYTRPHRIH
jgi:hypothetical protein